ncbi:putative cytochrome 93A1-like [Capsicum annuum]|nr:putative cytochrome 93A1-like [Capsicum annuum]
MEARYFYFTIHSASNLKDVRKLGEMKVYAKVSIAGKSKYTSADLVNKTNPVWNTTFCFIVPEVDIIRGEFPAKIELFCQRSRSHDKYVGELDLILRPFYIGECTFPLHRNDSNQSKRFGTLKFSHELGDEVLVVVSNSSSSTEDSNA